MHGLDNTPAQAKKREVNANVNSIILKSLPKFGKLFRIIEFTFAFTSLSFACAGVLFAPQALALLRCSLAASSPCRYSPVAQQPCSAAAALCCSSVAMQTGSPTILCWPRSRSKHCTEQDQTTIKYLWHFARHKTTKNIVINAFLVTCDSHREHQKPGCRHMIVERRCSKTGFKNGP